MSLPPNMAATVDRFGWPVTFRHYGAPAKNADGYLSSAVTATVAGRCHLYPKNGRRSETLQAGKRSGGVWGGGTTTEVWPAIEGQRKGTHIVWGARTFEVVEVSYYAGAGGVGGYYEIEAREVTG